MTDQTHAAPLPAAAPDAGADPSMEDILASIRRILSEDETAPPPPVPVAGAEAEEVLELDAAMMVSEPSGPVAAPEVAAPEVAAPAAPSAVLAPATSVPPEPSPLGSPGLVGPATEAAAASSVAALLRTLASDRALQVRSTGPTIEELVRQGLRPLLKEWLDANLPALVERLVRTEIERVVGRAMH